MKKWIILLIAICWFPHSLERVHRLGFDFPIYYNYAKYGHAEGWLYAEWVKYIFKPFTVLSMDWAFVAWYALLVLGWVRMAALVPRRMWLFIIFSFYPMLLCLELGQITPLLAWLCCFPVGAMVATGIKPYCIVFVFLHLYTGIKRNSSPQTFLETKSHLPPPTYHSSLQEERH